MKPLFAFALFSVTSLTSVAQDKDAMIVEDRPLAWEDFRGRHKSEVFDAQTNYIVVMMPNRYMPGDPIPAYHATAYFNPKESSVDKKFLKERPDDAKANLLKHEQGHYDLARIAARQINEVFKTFNWHPRRSLYQADSIYRSINNYMRIIQLKYDKETNHSKIKEEQERWNSVLATALDNKKLPE